MSDKTPDKVLTFDTLFTNNHIQILKVLLFYLPEKDKKQLAVFIKFLELQYTLSYFEEMHFGCNPLNCSSVNSSGECSSCQNFSSFSFGKDLLHNEEFMALLSSLLQDVEGYLSPAEKEMINRIKGMKNTMDMMAQYKEMMEMMSAMQGMGGFDMNNFDMSSFGMGGFSADGFGAGGFGSDGFGAGGSSTENADIKDSSTGDFDASDSDMDSFDTDSSDKGDSKEEKSTSGTSPLFDALSAFLSPEQQLVFEALQSMQNSAGAETATDENTP